MSLVPTLSIGDLPTVGATPIVVEGVEVALVRDGTGHVFAIRDECSHAQVRLSEGEVEPGAIECWLHCAQFDLATGEPLCLPATQPVPVFRVEVLDGVVHVDVHAGPPTEHDDPQNSGAASASAAKEH